MHFAFSLLRFSVPFSEAKKLSAENNAQHEKLVRCLSQILKNTTETFSFGRVPKYYTQTTSKLQQRGAYQFVFL